MSCVLFDGKAFAKDREHSVQKQVNDLRMKGKSLYVKSFTFDEDEGSRLYTKLKQAAATRVGITYEPQVLSLQDSTGAIIQTIRELSYASGVSGIMVQKPAKSVWMEYTRADAASFEPWWTEIVSSIDPYKDVDCLTPTNLSRISTHTQLLPATVKACLSILEHAQVVLGESDALWTERKALVIGKSDIVGKPLSYMLRTRGHKVNNVGRKDLAAIDPKEFSIIVSAAGSPNVVTGDMVAQGAVVIDVGSPTNDVERATVEKKAAFLTPVPGGVGPVTVISLMENIIAIVQNT